MNARYILLCLALFFMEAGLQAQNDLPQVFSPNAAELGKYGKIPVSYFNGLPNISIPLTELKAKGYTLPVYLTYHASGIRTEQMPSWVGLGWSLHAGGSINRIVNGQKDEMEIEEAIYLEESKYQEMQLYQIPLENPGYLYHKALVQNELSWTGDLELRRYCDYEGLIDYEPDEFQINLEGIQASFYIDEGGIRIVSRDDVSFEIDYELDTLRNYELKRWNSNEKMIVQYFQYIKKITLTDRLGIKYIFGGDLSSIEFSYLHHKKDATQRFIGTANTWHLATIEMPLGERIHFSYEKDGIPIIVTNEHKKVYVCKVDKVFNGGNPITTIYENYTSETDGSNLEYTFLHPSYLVSIQSEMTGDHLEFSRDPSSYEMDFQVDVAKLQNRLGNLNHISANRLISESRFYHLTSIEGVRSKIILGHSQYIHPIVYWTSSDILPGNPSYLPPIERLKLTSVSIAGADGNDPAYYFLKYNSTKPPHYNSKLSDHWGFYNGHYYGGVLQNATVESDLFYKTILTQQFNAIRVVDTSFVKAGVLERIIYPTGGSSRFIFEPHEYHKEITQFPFQLITAHGLAGGLRIKAIIDSLPGKREVRTYDYHSSGILSGRPQYGITGYGSVNISVSGTGLFGEDMSIDTLGTTFRRYRMGSERHLNQLSTTNGNHVTYSKVTERRSDGSCTVYEYSNHQESPDELPLKTVQNVDNSILIDRFTSNDLGRGLLKSKTLYSTSGAPVLREEYTYQQDHSPGNYLYSVTREDPSGKGYTIRASICKVYTYFPALVSKTTRAYPDDGGEPRVEIIYYEHDSNRQVIKEEHSVGQDTTTIITTFPEGLNVQPYISMSQRGYKAVPIEIAYFFNGVLSEATQTSFQQITLQNQNLWYVPHEVTKAKIQTTTHIEDYVPLSTTQFDTPDVIFQSYDGFGNPIGVFGRDESHQTYQWDSTGVYLVGKVQDNEVWEYEWEPNVGLSSLINPRGIEESYLYDSRGRLIEVKDNSGNAIQSYSYSLATQTDEIIPDYSGEPEEYNPLHSSLSPVVSWDGTIFRLGNWWNWIEKIRYRSPGKQNPMRTLEYYDNLGRAAAVVRVGASPSGHDIISWTHYNENGIPFQKWSPDVFTGWSSQGVPLTQNSGYSDNAPFSLIQYDNSPLDRVRKVIGPGQAWHQANKGVTNWFLTNTDQSGDAALRCLKFSIMLSGNTGITFTRNGLWPKGSLSVNKTEDEDGRTLWIFKDMRDLTVLERRLAKAASGNTSATYADTYYLYDDTNRLIAVIPPELSNYFAKNSWSGSTETDPKVEGFAYQYRYDARGRMIAKKLPGAAWTYFIYDEGDRPVLTQDGNQRERSEWSFRLLDILGRECLTGTMTGDYNAFSNPLVNTQVYSVRDQNTGNFDILHGYTIQGLTLPTSFEVLTVNWWDDYSFLGHQDGMPETDYQYFPPHSNDYGERFGTDAKGLLTGRWSKSLGENPESWSDELAVRETWFYDDRSRIIRHIKGYPSGTRITELSGYSFTDEVTALYRLIHLSNNTEKTEEYTYTYDNWGRILETLHTLDSGTRLVLASNSYDSIGRLSNTSRGGSSVQNSPPALTSTFKYNVRDWLTESNNTLLSESLTYEIPRIGSTHSGQWNGDISSAKWRTFLAPSDSTWYDYSYDFLGRLTQANYGSGVESQYNFSRSYSYDLNGNMTLRHASDLSPLAAQYGTDLVCSWTSTNGNRAVLWDQNSYEGTPSQPLDPGLYPVDPGNSGEPEPVSPVNPGGGSGNGQILPPIQMEDEREFYTYDSVGNRTAVLDSQGDTICVMRYNLLNLPEEYAAASGDTIRYVYSADGEKMFVNEIPATSSSRGTEYAANYQLVNNVLRMIHTDAGYYSPVLPPAGVTGPVYEHFWYLKDHLGNNRVLADAGGHGIAAYDYDPFGEEIAVIASEYPYPFPPGAEESTYKFGSKEWSITTSTYDFEARQFSPNFHRFTTIDPLAEKHYGISPYVYCANNPVNLVDPMGLAWVPRTASSGELVGFDWIDDDDIQEDGRLPDGVYHQAIFFTDNGTFNNRSRMNIGSSIAVVYLADGTICTYNACTYPSNVSMYPTIPEGGYEASVGEHKGSYTALKMYDIGKSMDDNTINLGFVNPAHTNLTYAIGIDIHKAGQGNITGMTLDRKPVSAGCLLIDINQWDKFIDHFNNISQRNNKVGVIVSRSFSAPSIPNYWKYHPYKYIDGMNW